MVEEVAAGDEGPQLRVGHAPRQHPEPAVGMDERDPLATQAAGRTLDPPSHPARVSTSWSLTSITPIPGPSSALTSRSTSSSDSGRRAISRTTWSASGALRKDASFA